MSYTFFQLCCDDAGFKVPTFAARFSNFKGGPIARSLANFRETRKGKNDKRREFLRGV
jgi:hypothetical protein